MIAALASMAACMWMAQAAPPAAGRFDQPLPAELAARAADDARVFPPPRPRDAKGFGAHVSRTMALLATSTPAQHNRVKILVYGQSISRQVWSRQIEASLRARYPEADLVFENRAIGGFVSSRLLRTLEHDVIPFYPDLVIFHVYGDEPDYEAVIRAIRTRTTAEILIQNDFYNTSQSVEWHDPHSWVWLPDLARRWGLELADVRREWVDYLADQKLRPADLVGRDGAHLNAQGNFVLAEATARHLVHDPSRPVDPLGLVRTVTVGPGPGQARWTGRKLVLPFEGNRIDVLAARASSVADGYVTIAIDGKPPSQNPALYSIGRPNSDGNRDWPWQVGTLVHVDRGTPLLRETWTARLTEVAPGAKSGSFDVVGSVTGFDGSGKTEQPFVSRSGRVVLWPEDWFLEQPASRRYKVPIRAGFSVSWQVEPQFADTWSAPAWVDPSREAACTLAQGLAPGKHVLELIAQGGQPPPIAAFRIHRPLPSNGVAVNAAAAASVAR